MTPAERHGHFVATVVPDHMMDRYSDGGAADDTPAEQRARRKRRKVQRQARKIQRGKVWK